MPKFTKNSLWKPFWASLILSVLLGYAQVADTLPPALISLIALFLIFKATLDYPLRRRLLTVFVAITAYMTTVTAWFRNIEAFGWQDIAYLPPQFWLITAVLAVSALCALAATAVFYLTYTVIRALRLNSHPIRIVYLWAISMMLTELVVSVVFSLATKANGATVEPTWNMYSLALLTATNVFGNIARFAGLWGTSFVLYLCAGLVSLVLAGAVRRQLQRRAMVSLVILGVLITGMIWLPISSKPGQRLRIIAVSEPTSDNNYLQDLQQKVLDDIAAHPQATRIVVLPEYSKLLSPYGNSSVLTFNYDARYTYPETFENTRIYFSGTEDQYLEGKRYAETYLVNGKLEKIKRSPKTFLIPGGEYVIGWVGGILSAASQDTAALLHETRVRNVLQTIPAPPADDPLAEEISIHACSSLLVPYEFREQAQRGAGLFAVNVSYEQFNYAPEYKKFADRFARFTARSTHRPVAVGAFAGEAVIYDKHGEVVSVSSNGNTLAISDITTEHTHTPYVRLGDTIIVTILNTPLLVGIFMVGHTKLRRASSKRHP